MLTVHRVNSPIGLMHRETRSVPFDGQTPRELAAAYRDPGWTEEATVVIDGVPVPVERLDEPVPDSSVVVLVPYAGIPAIGAGFFGWLATTAINVGLIYLAGRISTFLMRRFGPDAPTERGDESSPTYAFDGIETAFGPGGPMPIVFGHLRVGGTVISSSLDAPSIRTGRGTDHDVLKVAVALSEGECYRVGDVDAGPCGEVDNLGQNDPFQQLPARPLPAGLVVNQLAVATTSSFVVGHLRMGTQRQAALPGGLQGASSVYPIGVELRSQVPYVYTTTSAIGELRLMMRFPSGLGAVDQQGKMWPFPVSFRLRYRTPGGAWTAPWTWVVDPPTPSRGALSFPGLVTFGDRAVWELEVTRLTRDDDLAVAKDPTFSQSVLSAVTEIDTRFFAYPHCCLLGLEITANERFRGLDRVTVPLKGILVRRWSSGSGFSAHEWVGPGGVETGRNPAWCLLEMFLNKRWGGGRLKITESNIDLASFKAWADYCAELVPGPDGDEPRHLLDTVFDSQMPFWEAVLRVCQAGRASPVIVGNTIKVVYDHVKPSVQLFNAAAISEMSVFWHDTSARPNVLDIEILNADRDWEQDIITVEDNEALLDPTSLDRALVRRERIALHGVTRPSHARREAIYMHRAAALRKMSVEFQVPLVALACEVGDRISVQSEFPRWFASSSSPPAVTDPMAVGWRTSRAATASNAVYLDHDVTLETGKTYQVLIQDSADVPQVRTLIQGPGLHRADHALVFSGAVVTYAEGALVALGEASMVVRDFVVTSIELEPKTLKHKVRATLYDEGVYTIPDAEEVPWDPGYGEGLDFDTSGVTPLGTVPSVIDLAVTLDESGVPVLAWSPPETLRSPRFRVYMRSHGDAGEAPRGWRSLGVAEQPRLELRGLTSLNRLYDLAVAIEDPVSGTWPAPDELPLVTWKAREFPPIVLPAVQGLAAMSRGEGVELVWRRTFDRRVDYYEVRRGVGWVGAEVVGRTSEPRLLVPDVRYGTESYMVAPRHAAGLYAAIATLPVAGVVPDGTVLAASQSDLVSGAAGTPTGMTYTGGKLVLDAGEYHGDYVSAVLDAGEAREHWWSAAAALEVEDQTLLADDHELVESDDSLWSTVGAADARTGAPGADFDVPLAEDLGLVSDDGPLTGELGVVGQSVRMRVQARFDPADAGAWSAWEDWRPGRRHARRMQVRLVVDRCFASYACRVPELTLAVAKASVAGAAGRTFSLEAMVSEGTAGVSSVFVTDGVHALSSGGVGIPIPVACKTTRVIVAAKHVNGSDPGDWTLRLRKNGSGSDAATFTVEFDASSDVLKVTAGSWSSEVTFAAGDYVWLLLDGPAVNELYGKITMLFETV